MNRAGRSDSLFIVCTIHVLFMVTAAAAQVHSDRVAVPEALKLSRLVDLTSQAGGRQYSYNPSDLDATVTLRIGAPLSPAELQELLVQVLAARGFAIVQAPGSPVLSILKTEQAAAVSRLGDAPGAGFVTLVIPIKAQSAKTVADVIRPLLSKPGGAATVLGDSSLLVLSEFTSRLAEIRPLIDAIDVPDAVVMHEVKLRNVNSQQATAMVTQLAAKRELAGAHKLIGDVLATPDGRGLVVVSPPAAEQAWVDLITQADQREAVATITYAPRYFAAKDVSKLVEAVATSGGATADERFKTVVDELTSSLIVTATTSQHDRIAALLDRLDSNDRGPTPFRSYPIRNRPVTEILTTLQQLIAAGILETDNGAATRAEVTAGASQSTGRAPLLPQQPMSSSPPANGIGPQSLSTRSNPGSGNSKPPLSLTADEATNTLIAIGEPRLLSQLEALLTKLDVRQPQVMLEVTLLSLTDSDALALGTELEKIGIVGDSAFRLSSLFGLSTGPAATRSAGDATGFTGAVLNPGEFSIIFRALQSLEKGRSLSNPKLLVSNNEKAVFSSTVQQPVQSTTRTGSNDTTFSYGGTENAGTTISVKPQIAQGDHLVLTYSIKLSSFVGASATPGLPPPKQENAVDSVATIPDGHTVVVGGLDLVTDSKGEARVPLVADIPIIGELFKNRNNSDNRTRFFVFIKATVLRSGSFEDLKYISEVDTGKVGVDDGFPVVLPRVIR